MLPVSWLYYTFLLSVCTFKIMQKASLVAQWLKKNPPASAGGTGLIPDPGGSHTHGATEPVRHAYWVHVPQLLRPACPGARAPNKRPWQ